MTESYRRPPTQKALPLIDWSFSDRRAWEAAQAKAGVLDEGGEVSHLRPRSLQDMTSRYAYFLYFLVGAGRFNRHGPAAALVTEESILLLSTLGSSWPSEGLAPAAAVPISKPYTRATSRGYMPTFIRAFDHLLPSENVRRRNHAISSMTGRS